MADGDIDAIEFVVPAYVCATTKILNEPSGTSQYVTAQILTALSLS